MCTVTYLPGGNNKFILTSSRDEQVLRKKAFPPQKYLIDQHAVYYPRDMQAGGTWIATSESSFTLCLLNGAFQKHVHQPPYSKSRGIMLLDFFKFNDVNVFTAGYDFNGIEPFTLLLLDNASHLQLYELRWDGNSTELKEISSIEPAIWSSVTLYEPEVIAQREEWFREWLKHNDGNNQDAIVKFHETGGVGNKSIDLLMNRDNLLRTLSITSVSNTGSEKLMKYKDVVENQVYAININ